MNHTIRPYFTKHKLQYCMVKFWGGFKSIGLKKVAKVHINFIFNKLGIDFVILTLI